MKKIAIIIGVLIIIGLGIWAWQASEKSPVAKINNRSFKLYVAKTEKDKQIGLSKYKKIENERGMVFSFSKANYYPFWMKEMKFPIDIIYINDGKIVTIYRNVPTPKDKLSPPVYNSTKPADTVLEVNAGLSQKYNFKEGDTVSFSNI
ncbi:MAG: DUF192 domain-containing protein [Patescibacteria group bacterium]